MDDTPATNQTKAHVTGKVPAIMKPRHRGKAGKRVRLSAGSRRHVSNLQKRGEISANAAAQAGIK